jgi:hypothetical protein
MVEAPKIRRRWLQFGLGPMLLLVTVFAVWLAWELRFVRERQAYMQRCAERPWPCLMAPDAATSPLINHTIPVPSIPIWRRWLGDEAVVYVGHPEYETPDSLRRFRLDCQRLFPEAVWFGRESVLNALDQITTVNFDCALAVTQDYFAQKHEYRWHFDEAAFASANIRHHITDSFVNVPLHDALEKILEPHGLTYRIEQGELAITVIPIGHNQ